MLGGTTWLPQASDDPSIRPHPLDSKYQHVRLLKYICCPRSPRDTSGNKSKGITGSSSAASLSPPHVAIVCLDRPRKRNAMHAALWKELGTLFGTVLGRSGDDCRAVLLTSSSPDCFSAGIDVSDKSFLMPKNSLSDGDDDDNNTESEPDLVRVGLSFAPKIQEMQDCFTALERCPVPVMVAISGHCIGAGIDLACCADVRLCSDEAIFSVREVALGLAADVGTLQRLPKIVGNESLARELCLTGRNLTAKEALEIGFVSRMCPKDDLISQALELCAVIARHSPIAVHGTKKALLYARDHSVSDGLEQIVSYNVLALQGDDLEAAWTARATKTLPRFTGIPPYSKL